MPKAIVGMPFRKELGAESGHCLVADAAIVANEHEAVNRHVEMDQLTVCEKRLH